MGSNFKEIQIKAEKGEAEAQAILGSYYFGTVGFEQDHEKVRYWSELAAKQGNAMGQAQLGTVYSIGLGVEVNNEKALYWYKLAAEQGHIDAISNLGVCLLDFDPDEAIHWLRLGAEKESAHPSLIHSWSYLDELPVDPDQRLPMQGSAAHHVSCLFQSL